VRNKSSCEAARRHEEGDRAGAFAARKARQRAEIAKATNWQNHTFRGFTSGTVSKKMGLKIESAKNESGERAYLIRD
jgi:Protein of unknown function (DUF3489)